MGEINQEIILKPKVKDKNKVFDLVVEYFESRDWPLTNYSKPTFARFEKGSKLASVTIGIGYHRGYDVKVKQVGENINLTLVHHFFASIPTSSDRANLSNESHALKEFIENHF